MNRISTWLRTASAEVRVAVLLLLLGGAVVLVALGQPDAPVPGAGRGAGLIGAEFAGTPAAADQGIGAYGLDGRVDLTDVFWWHAAFLFCLGFGLALLARWGGRNYRTVSTRRLSRPLAWAAVGGLFLALTRLLLLWLGLDQRVEGVWPYVACLAWGSWLIFLLVAAYGAGGVLSRLLRGEVLKELRKADDDDPVTAPTAEYTAEAEEGKFGLAFSGGGVRAASISLGALQGLEGSGSIGWDSAHHITSVSGGSYMAGAWSLARTPLVRPEPPPEVPPAPPANTDRPRAWEAVQSTYGAEERHLRANLGYLLSNSPRGTGDDSIARSVNPSEAARRTRVPAAVATVLTGMVVNGAVFLAMLWLLSQLLGIFYRWYFALGGLEECSRWRFAAVELDLDPDGACLEASDRILWPIVFWLIIGFVAVLLWVLAAKATEVTGDPTPPGWLLGLKYLGYGGLGLAAGLGVLLGLLPFLLRVLWDPVEGNQIVTNLVAIAGAIGSASAVLRLLRRPLAKVAPVLGGLLFALVLAYVVCYWALGAMTAAPASRDLWWYWAVFCLVLALLGVLHFVGTIEFWSLAAFYRGKLRSAFATYRVPRKRVPDGRPWDDVRARAYVNNSKPPNGELVEPQLSALQGTPLTICASATITGRQVRTHYGIPALSVTFSPEHVRLHAPLDEDGRWQRFECETSAIDALLPAPARLTTMMAVGMSGAAVSPAMGRFNIGPVSMLLAFFNVRLGMWIPNPRYAKALAGKGKRLPRPGLGYLLKEFLGFHDPSDLYLYVTDGGHWENTALVELLRTCHHREIVCVDADAGPGNLAKSISQAIDLAQLECAATIAISLDVLRADRDPSPGRDYSPRSVNVGLVRRRDGADERISVLWYCKPALTQDMPPQLLAYREVDPTFPRVSTIDQFFHVAQFAAYRDLGRYNARKILVARENLRKAVTTPESFELFRGSLPSKPAPDDWVLSEMADLIDQLSADRGNAREKWADWIYSHVRYTLTGNGPPPPERPVLDP